MNSREKGKRGERQWRDELRAHGFAARRGQQFSGLAESPDVVCPDLPWAHFEVKLAERLDLYAALEQARRDCGGKAAFVAHRRNLWPWLVTMDAERFYRLLRVDLSGEWAEQMACGAPGAACAGLPWLFCEVRECGRLNIHEVMAEVCREALGRVAVVAHRRPGERWIVTLKAESFFQFLRGLLPPEGTGVRAGGGMVATGGTAARRDGRALPGRWEVGTNKHQ
jgi:hypothetical protein